MQAQTTAWTCPVGTSGPALASSHSPHLGSLAQSEKTPPFSMGALCPPLVVGHGGSQPVWRSAV